MSYDPTLKSALDQTIANFFVAIEIIHPFKTIRLLDGLGYLNVNGDIFVGVDEEVGALGGIEVEAEGTGDEAPEMSIMLNQVSSDIAIELCKPNSQGSQISMWVGSFDTFTGQAIGEPYLWFLGEIDVPTYAISEESASVTFSCNSVFEVFFETDDGMRLNDSFHQSVWPGELGFQYVTDVTINMPWGQSGAKPTLSKASK